MVDLNQIALFVQVVESGSFVRASRRLGIPPATLSRQVAQLEDVLAARLLQRTTRKLSLTDAGRILYEQSVAQIDALKTAAEAVSSQRHKPKGSVRIAGPAGFFDYFDMAWVADFLNLYPDVSVEFVLSDSVADLIDERIDVAFRGSSTLPDSSLVARKLASGALTLAASPAYLAARGTPGHIQALSEHDCIRASNARGPVLWRLNGPEGTIQFPVSGRFSANTVADQRKAAIAGLGICLLPHPAVAASLAAGDLVEILPGVASNMGNLFIVYASRRHLPTAVAAFVDMAVQRLAERNLSAAES